MKRILFTGLLFVVMAASAQKVALKPESWTFRPGAVEFDDSAGVTRMKIVDGRGFVVLRGTDFSDGTIEFDDIPTDPTFALFCFRFQDSLENECFYFRTGAGIGHPYAMAGVQYTPVVKGVMYWDALPHYQTFASFWGDKYNHVRMVLSGRQMRVWVNSVERPTLEVTRLEGGTTHGTFAFQGKHIISNLVLKPGQGSLRQDESTPVAGNDPTDFDSRYLRHWQMTEPDTAGENVQRANRVGIRGIPGEHAVWRPIDAERRGFVNLSRVLGGTNPFGVPRTMWLKTMIHAETARPIQLRLGFLDDVSVFVNGQLLYEDKNYYGSPIAKVPNGRLSIENATITVPLKEGDNELKMRVGSNFYTWGIVARLDDLEGVSLER
jgi:hypothetical protein